MLASELHSAKSACDNRADRDGVAWSKAPLDVVPGTNIVIRTTIAGSWVAFFPECQQHSCGQVINQVLKSNNVWLDHEDANASRRYKLADTGGTDPATGAFAASYRLWSSADGVHVSAATAGSGRGCDRVRGWL